MGRQFTNSFDILKSFFAIFDLGRSRLVNRSTEQSEDNLVDHLLTSRKNIFGTVEKSQKHA